MSFEPSVHAGAYIAGLTDGPDGALAFGGLGLELEVRLQRGLALWTEVGLVPVESDFICPGTLPPGDSCETDSGLPWSVVTGVSFFPGGSGATVAPYIGGGLGAASPGQSLEPRALVRTGLDIRVVRILRLRTELRFGTDGWGAGLGLLF